MIDEIRLAGTAFSKSSNNSINDVRFLIFTGPNNSGKSLILREIRNILAGNLHQKRKIVENIVYSNVDFIRTLQANPNYMGHLGIPGTSLRSGGELIDFFVNEAYGIGRYNQVVFQDKDLKVEEKEKIIRSIKEEKTKIIGGSERLDLLKKVDIGPYDLPQNTVSKIFRFDNIRKEIQNIVLDAFGFYLAIDFFEGSVHSVRFGKDEPKEEKTFSDSNRDWMKNALAFEDVGDGVRAFSGIIAETHIDSAQIILIDEPEAFLHPALTYKLGKHISELSRKGSRQIITATHSPSFVMGALQHNKEICITRLNYRDNVSSLNVLDAHSVSNLFKDPHLRSASAISALFHEYVVVVEGNSDRVFYSEINEQLVQRLDTRGVEGALFINGNGKDVIHKLTQPLRSLGIPAACIYDLDFIWQPESVFSRTLNACSVSSADLSRITSSKKRFCERNLKENIFKGDGKGRKIFLQAEENFVELTKIIELYGIFIVPVGAVENWLQHWGIPSRKNMFIQRFLEKMEDRSIVGTDEKMTSGDVWDFVGSISAWLKNPGRLGV